MGDSRTSQVAPVVKKWCEVTQSCPTLCDPMDCSLPGFFIHWIFQARVLEWIATSFSRGSSWPRDWTGVSRVTGRFLNVWAPRKSTACHCRRLGFSPWIRKVPWRSAWQPIAALFPGESRGQRSWRAVVQRVAKSRTWLKQRSTHPHIGHSKHESPSWKLSLFSTPPSYSTF